MHISKSKLVAILIYIGVVGLVWLRGNTGYTQGTAIVLGIFLIAILFSRLFAWSASWGMMESLASDHGKGVPTSMASLFYWILYLIACAFFVFEWSIY